MTSSWKQAAFTDCFDDVTRLAPKVQKSIYMPTGTYPVVDQGQEDIAGYVEDKSLLYKGDLPVIIFGDHTRIFKYVDYPFVMGADGVRILLPKKEIDPQFAYYALRQLIIESQGYSRHYRILKEKIIKYPGKDVQKRIVSILRKMESIIHLRKQQISKVRSLIPTIFVSMFGNLGINNKNHPITSMEAAIYIDAPMIDPREERYLDLIHIGPDRIEKGTGRLLPALTAREENLISNKFLFDERYLLYSKIRPYLKKAALPNFSGLCSADMYPIRPQEEKTTREFIFALLLSDAFTEYTKTLAGRVSIPKLNRTELNAYKFPLPPLKDQERFSSLLRNVFRKIDIMEAALKKQEMLFQSLLHSAFEGIL